ncbi:NAD(P)H-dependent flavin oxidoreductase [Photobacterium rosenbergii]|uniref:NAD(P)H-dependent flavin oxidoreductase n=1 Tax=Photobacterium rosenbergii TaxID=294936 RepID=UPI001C9A1EA6|nr:nitronate monooxygenase [Photobacterium rosenbergii]MBY5946022.1 nitronate monooxygenase [Photobacterium rosenbergii]
MEKDLFGTTLPIIQSPMAGVQDSELAIAVSEAGGLGSLPCGMLSIEKIISEIESIKSATDKPFNLNFFCHEMPKYNPARQAMWQETLKPYFTKAGTLCASQSSTVSRLPFNHDIADAIEPFSPPVISFHFGLPDKDLLTRIKRWGTRVISTATTVDEAIWLESQGVDAVIAQGIEAGGHRGMFLSEALSDQLGLFSLVPQIVAKINIPVIAAGGIASSEGVNAAMMLGAEYVQVGTSYLLCTEAKTSPIHRLALKGEHSNLTAVTNIFSGRPARGIVNRAMAELGYLREDAPEFPFASIEMAQLRALYEKQGVGDFSPLWSGQNTSGCKEVSAKELTQLLAQNF